MGDDALQPRNPLRAQSNKFLPSAHHFPDSGLGQVSFFPPLIPFLGRPSSFLESFIFELLLTTNSFCVRVLVHFSHSLIQYSLVLFSSNRARLVLLLLFFKVINCLLADLNASMNIDRTTLLNIIKTPRPEVATDAAAGCCCNLGTDCLARGWVSSEYTSTRPKGKK